MFSNRSVVELMVMTFTGVIAISILITGIWVAVVEIRDPTVDTSSVVQGSHVDHHRHSGRPSRSSRRDGLRRCATWGPDQMTASRSVWTMTGTAMVVVALLVGVFGFQTASGVETQHHDDDHDPYHGPNPRTPGTTKARRAPSVQKDPRAHRDPQVRRSRVQRGRRGPEVKRGPLDPRDVLGPMAWARPALPGFRARPGL